MLCFSLNLFEYNKNASDQSAQGPKALCLLNGFYFCVFYYSKSRSCACEKEGTWPCAPWHLLLCFYILNQELNIQPCEERMNKWSPTWNMPLNGIWLVCFPLRIPFGFQSSAAITMKKRNCTLWRQDKPRTRNVFWSQLSPCFMRLNEDDWRH
jgi:hypothetical protein